MRLLSAAGLGLALVGPGLLVVLAASEGVVPGRGLLVGLGAALLLLVVAGSPDPAEGEAAGVVTSWTLPGLAAVLSAGVGWCYLALAPLGWWGIS